MTRLCRINPGSPDLSQLETLAADVKNGALIVYPTETFYGLGALYNNLHALRRIFTAKDRDAHKPLLLLLPDSTFLPVLASSVHPEARAVAEHFWPGPLTLLFKASSRLSSYITAGTGSVGCRVSSNSVAASLLGSLKLPLTSTSANLAGGKSPVRIDDIPASLLDRVDIILDAGETAGGLPSTIIDTTTHPFSVVRDGALPCSDIFTALQSLR